jgi:hypothetical protein
MLQRTIHRTPYDKELLHDSAVAFISMNDIFVKRLHTHATAYTDSQWHHRLFFSSRDQSADTTEFMLSYHAGNTASNFVS